MIMRNSLLILFSFLLIMPSVNAQSDPGMAQVIDRVLSQAESQSLLLAKTMEEIPDALPRTVDKEGKLITSNSAWWCSGFFPGTLWYLYENSGNKELEKYALVTHSHVIADIQGLQELLNSYQNSIDLLTDLISGDMPGGINFALDFAALSNVSVADGVWNKSGQYVSA